MPKTPIEMMLDGTEWIPIPEASEDTASDNDIPFATHSGVLEFGGEPLRVYRLSDGRAVIDCDDFERFFASLGEQ